MNIPPYKDMHYCMKGKGGKCEICYVPMNAALYLPNAKRMASGYAQ